MDEATSIEWRRSGRGKAQCPPDPDYPNGCHVDISEGQTSCMVNLPYPAPECGAWIVRCAACGMSAAITAAGRPDDPRSVRIPCKGRMEAA
jgi:predicted RNA-binding Zn-ribbon protein involved in translation (DUF1610 family)